MTSTRKPEPTRYDLYRWCVQDAPAMCRFLTAAHGNDLGALNGPDLALMQKMLPDPSGILSSWPNIGKRTAIVIVEIDADGEQQVVGVMVDAVNAVRPAGLVHLSTATRTGVEVLQDNGSTYAPGTATHHLTQFLCGGVAFAGIHTATHIGIQA